MSYVFDNSEARLGDRLVLLSIANHADKHGRNAWPSIAGMAEEAHMSERQVKRAIRNLAELGEIEIEENGGPKGTHCYTITGMQEAPLLRYADDDAQSSEAISAPRHPQGSNREHGDNMSGDNLSPDNTEGDKLSPEGGDKSDQKGVTNRTKTRSDLSPEPSYKPSREPSDAHARVREAVFAIAGIDETRIVSPGWHMQQTDIIEGWVAEGFAPDDIARVCKRVMATRQERTPPRDLRYFDTAVRRDCKARRPGEPKRYGGYYAETLKPILQRWFETGEWRLSAKSPPPGEPGCFLSVQEVAELMPDRAEIQPEMGIRAV